MIATINFIKFLFFLISTFDSPTVQEISSIQNILSSPKDINNSDIVFLPTAAAPTSVWANATLAFNFEGEGSDNFIGGAQVALESVEKFKDDPFFDLLVVGNLSKITSSIGEDPSDDISELIQSNQGLSIGISPVWVLNKKKIEEDEVLDIWRIYGHVGYKINGFQDVGDDEETVNIHQFRTSLGLDFEGFRVLSGSPFNISTEIIFTAFDGVDYGRVFENSTSNIIAWESSIIIPVGNNVGFLAKYTVANQGDNIFQAGLVLRTSE